MTKEEFDKRKEEIVEANSWNQGKQDALLLIADLLFDLNEKVDFVGDDVDRIEGAMGQRR